jgi:hypothetical protein
MILRPFSINLVGGSQLVMLEGANKTVPEAASFLERLLEVGNPLLKLNAILFIEPAPSKIALPGLSELKSFFNGAFSLIHPSLLSRRHSMECLSEPNQVLRRSRDLRGTLVQFQLSRCDGV